MNNTPGKFARLLLVLVIALAAVPACSASVEEGKTTETAGPSATQARKAQLIGELLSQYHYREQDINDAAAAQALDAYLKALDQERYYFLEGDIAEFQALRTRLDDGLVNGDLAPAYQIFRRYQQRVRERADFAVDALKDSLDFSADERLALDRSESPWARTSAELDRLWLKRIKNDALTLEVSGQELPRIKEILTKRYQRLARTVANYTPEEIFQTYMNGWAQVFDPHTAYLSPRLSENFDIHMRLSLEGIGAMLRSENDFTEVVELVPGGPAHKSGQLQPGDRIIGVGQGDRGEIVDVVGWRLPDVVDLIRGPKETTVRLQVLPKNAGDASARVISLMRNQVQLEEQAAQAKTIKVGEGEQARRIGVITLPGFYIDFAAAEAGNKDYRSTTRDVRRLVEQLKAEGMDGLVIDLRGNGGGSLREATELTGLFVHGGPVVQVRRQDGDVEVLQDHDDGVAYEGPLTVLVDRFSASASEIFAGAIQDYGRGVVIGQQTFGKGTVQTLVDLDRFGFKTPAEPGGRLKLTIAKFYRISGASTQRRGVVPDISLPSTLVEDEFGEDASETALPWDEIRAVPFRPEGELTEVLPVLRDRHEQRMRSNLAFQALIDEYAQLRELRAKKTVSLNEKTRLAEREQAEQAQLRSLNRRLALYKLPPLESLEEVDEDELPDTVLETAAAVAADLASLRPGTATASNWAPPRAVAR